MGIVDICYRKIINKTNASNPNDVIEHVKMLKKYNLIPKSEVKPVKVGFSGKTAREILKLRHELKLDVQEDYKLVWFY